MFPVLTHRILTNGINSSPPGTHIIVITSGLILATVNYFEIYDLINYSSTADFCLPLSMVESFF